MLDKKTIKNEHIIAQVEIKSITKECYKNVEVVNQSSPPKMSQGISSLNRKLALTVAILAFVAGLLLLVPDLYDRISWRLQKEAVTLAHYINPELNVVPTPQNNRATFPPTVLTPAAVIVSAPIQPITSSNQSKPLPVPPAEFQLNGFVHTWQKLNNCGPATLSINLSYWGWKGTQSNTATALKPDPNDRNVRPDEMVAYAQKVGLGAITRVGGSIPLIKQFIAAGIPVIVEKGIMLDDVGWEGHYILLTGYSDSTGMFNTQDTLQGPNFPISYDLLMHNWRAFNYTYLITYPPERQSDVERIIGVDMDERVNHQNAANLARNDLASLKGQDLAFAWFNLGTNFAELGDYANAASAYDQSRTAQLPWRMLWYQFSLYDAYFNAKRYTEVIVLSEATLAQANNIEEAYYWHGRALLAQGNKESAIADWRNALRYNRNYSAPAQALKELGISP